MRTTIRTIVALASVAALATGVASRLHAQATSALTGPVVGYVWNPDISRLHPINGVTGSATIGPALSLPFNVHWALPVDGARVLLTDDDASLVLLDLQSNQQRAITSGLGSPRPLAAASSNGAVAAVIDLASHRLVVIGGLTSQPVVLHDASLTDGGHAITRLAVNDSGTMVVFTASEGGEAALYVWTPDAALRFLGTGESFDALAITADDRIVVANATLDEVFLAGKDDPQTGWHLLDGRATGAAKPLGVASTSDGRVFVANAGDGTVTTFASGGRRLGSVSCACTLTRLERLRNGLYRLTDQLDQTLYLFDAQASVGRVYFVPPRRP